MKRKKHSAFEIDGRPMLNPDAGIGLKSADIESAGTGSDEGGFTHRILVRSDVKTWDFSYAVLTAEEYVYMMDLLKGKATFTFTFKNERGYSETVKAYCKQRSAAYWSHRRGLYKNLKFTIYQC